MWWERKAVWGLELAESTYAVGAPGKRTSGPKRVKGTSMADMIDQMEKQMFFKTAIWRIPIC